MVEFIVLFIMSSVFLSLLMYLIMDVLKRGPVDPPDDMI